MIFYLGVTQTVEIGDFPTSFAVNNFPSAFGVNNFPSSFNIGNLPATQAISAVSLPLPTGAASETTLGTRALETGGNLASVKTNTDKLDVNISTRALETGGNLASVKTNTDKLDVNLSTVATQTTLAAVKAALDTLNTTINTLNDKVPALGQAVSANSEPSVIASDQSPIPFDLQNFSRALAQQFITALTKSSFIKKATTNFLSTSNFDAFPVYLDGLATTLTIPALTTLNQFGAVPIRDVVFTPQERQLFASNTRARIS